MRFVGRRALVLTLVLATLPVTSTAQDRAYFIGLIAGSSQLSGDPTTIVTNESFATSNYKPATGPAVNVFAGVHLREYLTLQANYTWNRNGVTLFAAEGTPTESRFYEQPHVATQHTLIGDVLVYFRERGIRIRPYLSGGVGLRLLHSDSRPVPVAGGLSPPAAAFTATDFTIRVAVGADVPIGGGWAVRYSFSENLSANPFSGELDPRGTRGLMNFQNLVGVMRAF